MITPFRIPDGEMSSLLEQVVNGHDVERHGGGRWSLTLIHADSPPLEAHHSDDGWITFQTSLSCRRSCWSLLKLNEGLPGPAKFVWSAVQDSPLLIAEVLIDDVEDGKRRCEKALTGIEVALSRWNASDRRLDPRQGAGPGTEENSGLVEDGPMSATLDLAGLCGEAGWLFARKEYGAVSVNIEMGGNLPPYRALLEPGKESEPRARLSLIEIDSPCREARQALGHFLLAVSGMVRLVRASSAQVNGRSHLFLEVGLPPRPLAWEIDHALSAISVACHLCGPEVEALREPELARIYMQKRGGSPRRTHHLSTRSNEQRRKEPWQLSQPVN